MSQPPLSEYAAAVGELLLHLRHEGIVLSSMDQHLLASWWEAGYPLPVVLRTVRDTGERLLRRKSPPRGLPLKSMRKQVEKAAEAVLVRQEAAPTDLPDAAREASDLLGAARASVASRHRAAPSQALEQASAELAALDPQDPDTAFVELLAVSRRYYERRCDALSSSDRARRRAEALASLGERARRMAPDAREATVEELIRRSLKAEDPVLDPLRLETDR